MSSVNQDIAGKSGYKKTKLGRIPKDWDLKKIGMASTITSGSTPLRSKYNLYYENGTIPWVKTLDLNNSYIHETEEKITELALNETSCKLLPKNTVLVAMYGGFNQIGRTGLLTIKAATNQAISAIQPINKILESRFLLFWLNYKINYWKKYAASSRKDPNITKNDVEHFPIILPNLLEQKKITHILTTWDRTIERTEALIEAKTQLKRGLMQQLLTGKKRFKEFKNEKWNEVRIGDLLKEVKRYIEVKNQELYNLISVKRRSDGLFFRESIRGDQIKTKNLKILREGDFLISKMQVVHGALGLCGRNFENMYISDSYIALVSKDSNKFYIGFFDWLSKMPKMYKITYLCSFGVHIEKMTFKLNWFLNYKIKIPEDVNEQRKISIVLSNLNNEINKLEEKLQHNRNSKFGLMQKLLTGKIRVNI